MNKREIIERLKNIAEHAVHTVGEEPFVMSLDDGIAVHEVIKLLEKPETNCSEFPNNSDTISRQAVTKFLNDWLSCLFENCHKQSASDLKMIIKDFKNLPSVQPDIIRCKDCIYQTESWSGIKYCEAHGDHIGKDYDYCSNARRKENG